MDVRDYTGYDVDKYEKLTKEAEAIAAAYPDQVNTPNEGKWTRLRELFLNEHPD